MLLLEFKGKLPDQAPLRVLSSITNHWISQIHYCTICFVLYVWSV